MWKILQKTIFKQKICNDLCVIYYENFLKGFQIIEIPLIKKKKDKSPKLKSVMKTKHFDENTIKSI